eukprot:scaffold22586_cov138-Cylindrotheca_fusiformis.AAC.3
MNSNVNNDRHCIYDPNRDEKLIIEHPAKRVRLDSMFTLNEIGISHFNRGKYCLAEKYFSQALAKCMHSAPQLKARDKSPLVASLEMVSESDDGSLSESSLTAASHPYDEGLVVYQNPLETHSKSTESVSATILYNIALTYVLQGLHRESMSWFVRTLKHSEGCPRLVFKTLSNLGFASFRNGCYGKALFCYTKALAMARQLNLSNAALAASMNSVAVIHFYNRDGSSNEAMELLEHSLDLYQSDEQSNRKEIATVWNNIGRIQYLESECLRALDSYAIAVAIREEEFGEVAMDVAATYFNIGQAHQHLRNFENAKESYTRFLQIAQCCLGPVNTEICLVYRCIGDVHYEEGDFKSALWAYEMCLTTSRASKGKYHPTLASVFNKAGNVCYKMSDYKKSLQYYTEGLAIERKVLKPNTSHMIITLSNIAHVYKLSGQSAKSLSVYRRILEMQDRSTGFERVEVANTLSHIGMLEYNLKDFDASFESYQHALRILREVHDGENHLCIAATLNSIGLVLFKKDLFQMARLCFVRALDIRQHILGPGHYDLAILWYNIATVYFETGDDCNAIKAYKESLRVESENMGELHDGVIRTVLHLASIFQQLGHLTEAEKHFREALKRLGQKRSKNFRLEVKVLNGLGNLYLQKGDVPNAIAVFTKATRSLCANNLSEDSLVITGLNYYSLCRMHPACAPVA